MIAINGALNNNQDLVFLGLGQGLLQDPRQVTLSEEKWDDETSFRDANDFSRREKGWFQ
jgi:hypothetical protein